MASGRGWKTSEEKGKRREEAGGDQGPGGLGGEGLVEVLFGGSQAIRRNRRMTPEGVVVVVQVLPGVLVAVLGRHPPLDGRSGYWSLGTGWCKTLNYRS